MSGEGTKERTDRVMLTPWVKFLWESYRNTLDLLKNNTTIKSIYADVAKKGRMHADSLDSLYLFSFFCSI